MNRLSGVWPVSSFTEDIKVLALFIPAWIFVPPPASMPLIFCLRLLAVSENPASVLAFSAYDTTATFTSALSIARTSSTKLFAAFLRSLILPLSFMLPDLSRTRTILVDFCLTICWSVQLTLSCTLAMPWSFAEVPLTHSADLLTETESPLFPPELAKAKDGVANSIVSARSHASAFPLNPFILLISIFLRSG